MLARGPSITAFLARAEESLSLLRTPWEEEGGEDGQLQAAPRLSERGTRSHSSSPRLGEGSTAPLRRPPRALPAGEGGEGNLQWALQSLAEREKDVQEQLLVQAKTLLGVDKRLHELEGRLQREASGKEDAASAAQAKRSPRRPKGIGSGEEVVCGSEGSAGGSCGSSACSTTSGCGPPAAAAGFEELCEQRLACLETRVREHMEHLGRSFEAEAQKRVERALEAHVSELLHPHGPWSQALEKRVSNLLSSERPWLQALEARIAGRMDVLEDRVTGLLEAVCPQSEAGGRSELGDSADSRSGTPPPSALEGYVTGLFEASKTRVLGQLKELEVREEDEQGGGDSRPEAKVVEDEPGLVRSMGRRGADMWLTSHPPWEPSRRTSNGGDAEVEAGAKPGDRGPPGSEQASEPSAERAAGEEAGCGARPAPADEVEAPGEDGREEEEEQREACKAEPNESQPAEGRVEDAQTFEPAADEAEAAEAEAQGDDLQRQGPDQPEAHELQAEDEEEPASASLGVEHVELELLEAEAGASTPPSPLSSQCRPAGDLSEVSPSTPHSCPSPPTPQSSVFGAEFEAPPTPSSSVPPAPSSPAMPLEETAARPRRASSTSMAVVVQDPAAVKSSPTKCSPGASRLQSPASGRGLVDTRVGAAVVSVAPGVERALAAAAAAAAAAVEAEESLEAPTPGAAAASSGSPAEDASAGERRREPAAEGIEEEGEEEEEEEAAPRAEAPMDDEDTESDETISVSSGEGRRGDDLPDLGLDDEEGEGEEERSGGAGEEEVQRPKEGETPVEAVSLMSPRREDGSKLREGHPKVAGFQSSRGEEEQEVAARPEERPPPDSPQRKQVRLLVDEDGETESRRSSKETRGAVYGSVSGTSSVISDSDFTPTDSEIEAVTSVGRHGSASGASTPPQVPHLPPLPSPAPFPSGPQTPAFGAGEAAEGEVWDEFLAGLDDTRSPGSGRPPPAPRRTSPRPWVASGSPGLRAGGAGGPYSGVDWVTEWERQGKPRTAKDIVSALTARSLSSPRKVGCDDMDRPWTARGPRCESPRNCSSAASVACESAFGDTSASERAAVAPAAAASPPSSGQTPGPSSPAAASSSS